MSQGAHIEAPRDAYRESGVDTDEADRGLSRLTERIRRTWPRTAGPGAVQLEIGYFANVISLGQAAVAICTDGIGSKALIAQMVHKYDTVGVDCVAMNVNDLVCVGARPLSLVDYIAVQTANADLLDALSVGLCEGAETAGISISGGEISQLKDIITGFRPGYGFDLVGTAIGEVAPDAINCGARVRPGDVIIGIESNGIHSNGLSLARRAFFGQSDFTIDTRFPELALPLGLELLRPTHIYVREVLEILRAIPDVKALIHITGDGLFNLTRVAASVGFVLDNLPPAPAIFTLIQRYGSVSEAEMYQVYNMGIGFCLVVDPTQQDDVMAILAKHHRKAFRIGYAIDDPEKQIRIADRLIGKGKKFRPIAETR
ncbi:MAG: phosphoribosylformylglycinamidine cyclo-ligase [Acetobacteraceae bacterium]